MTFPRILCNVFTSSFTLKYVACIKKNYSKGTGNLIEASLSCMKNRCTEIQRRFINLLLGRISAFFNYRLNGFLHGLCSTTRPGVI